MPTYQEEVLADAPVFYGRLDEPAGITVITDISGFNNNGSYYPDTVHGIASPIETDPSSRAVSGHVGFAEVTNESLDTFTWEVWGLHAPDITAGALITRGGQIVLSASNFVAIDSGSVRVDISAGGISYQLHYSLGLNYGWYHIVVTRSTNVLRLYVNGFLRAERTDLDTGSLSGWGIDISVTPNTYFGTGQTADVWHSPGTDEIAIYTTQLNAGRILAHYESGLATLPLSATITVRVVVELDTDQVDPVDFPFLHNFAEPLSGQARPIVEHLSYKTNTNQSQPDYQQRINAQPYHTERTLEYFVTPTSVRARAMMQAALWTPGQTYKLPIAKDWGVLTAQATTGASTLLLDTTLKDYEIGSHVVAFENVYQPWTAQFFQITSRTNTELGISPNVGGTLPIGSPVMPARLAILPEDSLSIDSHLIDRETAALQFEILSTELSTRRVSTYTPASEYLDIEVFNLERAKVEWVDPAPYQITRRLQGTGNPTGNDYQRGIDTGSPQNLPIRVLLASRVACSEFYGWMDARQGKINPVWIVSQESDLEVLSRTGSPATITISHIGYTSRYNLHEARRHVGILKADGSYVYRRITAAVDNGTTETLTLNADPPALADCVKVSFLRLCAAPDQFELRYHRDGADFIAECEFVLTELLTTPE